MATKTHTPDVSVGPTAESPEFGTIGIYNLPISKVAYWIEDGDHVFRSVEFDILAGAPTQDEAVSKFIDNAEDWADSVAELDEGDAAPDEVQAAMTIYRRLVSAYEEAERLERDRVRRMKLRRLIRRRPDSHRGFRPSPSPPQSSSPVPLA